MADHDGVAMRSSTSPAPSRPDEAESCASSGATAGDVPGVDDTLRLYFLCAHPALTPASAVALTLRAVGGLTTAQIAQAYLVPEATMAQRISRAKRAVSDLGLDQPGDLATVMHVLYLVFNEGYSGDVDLAAEAIRLTRQLATMTDDPEVAGLLALMLLHHARRPARTRPDGSLVTLAEQDRSRWDVALIAEGVARLQSALARDRLGPYQAQAAIAALHADAPRVEETDWVQIVGWYDELLRLTDTPVVRLNRAVAVGEADGPRPGSRRWPRSPTTSRGAAPSPPTSTSATVISAPRRACTPRPLATPRACRNAPTRPIRPHASISSCGGRPERASGPSDGTRSTLAPVTDLLLTHGYFLWEDEKEREIMKPYTPLGLLYISAYLKRAGARRAGSARSSPDGGRDRLGLALAPLGADDDQSPPSARVLDLDPARGGVTHRRLSRLPADHAADDVLDRAG